jgi:hypothetical protein
VSETIYVASSWRNAYYPAIVDRLRSEGHDVYDFRNPPHGNGGFNWRDIDPRGPGMFDEPLNYPSINQYIEMLEHPAATHGFGQDLAGMLRATAAVLVLPCGRSAHLEAGWFIGMGIPTAIYIPEPIEPELMYLLAHKVCGDLQEVVDFFAGDVPYMRGGR